MEIVGIDPGIVHTGVVLLRLDPQRQQVEVQHAVIDGPDATTARVWIDVMCKTKSKVFVEDYRPRSHFTTDKRMVEAVAEFRRVLTSATILDNTGIKKVVKQAFMERLGLWSFATPTHHGDLRSAARILLLGAFKDADCNRVLADFIHAHIKGHDWQVTQLA